MKFLFALLFIALVALFTFLSGPLYRAEIESDLEDKVSHLFSKERDLAGVQVTFDHLHLKLSGQVGNSKVADKAIAIATTAWGAYVPDISDLSVEPLQPAQFGLRETGDSLVLIGKLPSKELQSKLATAAANIPGVESVDDQTEVVPRVEPPKWATTLPAVMSMAVTTADAAFLNATSTSLTLAGTVATDSEKSEVLAKASPLGLELIDKLRVAPWSEPSVSFERRGDTLEVKGLLPDLESQKAVVTAARNAAGAAELVNKTIVEERVRPVWWDQHLSTFVPSFITKSSGDATVSYSNRKLFARGSTFEPETKKSLEKASALGVDGVSSDIEIMLLEPPAPHLIAERDNDLLLLTGEVGSAKDSADIEAAISAEMPDTEIDNQLRVVVPRAKLRPLPSIASTLPILFNQTEAPRLTARDGRVKIEGAVPSEADKTDIAATATALFPESGLIENALTVTAAPAAPMVTENSATATTLKSLAVYFNTASSYISSKEAPKIAEVSKILLAPGSDNSQLIVGGYADLRGNVESNRKLSLERAEAVREKLIALGIPAERMTLQHFGEDTSKAASSELWKSRRVEISITAEH